MLWKKFIFIVAVAGLLIGCGGSTTSTGTTTALAITPSAPTVEVNKTLQFTAVPTGGQEAVTWSVVNAGGGSITSAGLYTAPATAGTYSVKVALNRDPSIAATAAVTVSAGVTIAINSIGAKVVIPNSKVDLLANVAGTANTAVTWALPGGTSTGSVNTNGTYTAPATPGTYTVQARSVADTSKFATLAITVAATAQIQMDIAGRGVFTLQMRADKAPNTCANFVTLVNKGFYNGLKFHRREDLNAGNAVPDFIIQGGDPNGNGSGGPGFQINFETNDLTHNQYALAMARSSGRDTAGSQFYICQDAVHFLDGDYVVFGAVSSGFAVVDSMLVNDVMTTVTTIP